ncbi:hypothetical protein EYF80_023668 [Liparis tanakae]|uniref:Uncharacterized protein n=1 Tax=Liparis tanakae TaxID=230148 RepID=A0A4Z2HKW4_9TELE|nr:hypothetical protein EYF80_023668 [Liparis tanakae]
MASEGSEALMRGAVVAAGVKHTQHHRGGPKRGRGGRGGDGMEVNSGRSGVVSGIEWHAESRGRHN